MEKLLIDAENAGIQVEYMCLPLSKSISAPDPDGDIIIMDYSLMYPGAKSRVHFTHELGHCETGSFYNIHSPLDVRQKHENRADKWAINKLIPVDSLDAAIACGCDDIWGLAEYFNVSVEFMQKAICLHTYGNLAVECYF